MTTIASKTFLSALAVSAIAGIAMMAQTGSASARSVTSCEGTDRRSVIECCQTLVKRKGMPMWMKQSGRNCSTSTVCRAGGSGNQPTTHAVAPVNKCWVKYIPRDRDGGNDGHDNPGKGRDTPNGNPNGNPTGGSTNGNTKP